MTHSYHISGMTCNGCRTKVQQLLASVPGVNGVEVNLNAGEATIEMQQHIPTKTFQEALGKYPHYALTENDTVMIHQEAAEEVTSWLQTYKPLLIILGYLLTITLLVEGTQFSWMNWMNNFMAGFFLVFSFFKLLDLRGFADSYATYDVIARQWKGWGFVYPFVELGLGLAYAVNFKPLLTNTVTFVVMSVSIVGVLQSVLNKKKIRCACLGAVFNLPMSSITIIEDALMIAMSAIMLITIL